MAPTRRNMHLIVRCCLLPSVAAPPGGDDFKWRGSAPNPPRASVQEEGEPSESGQPGDRRGQTCRTFQEQEARQVGEEGERQTRSEAKGQSGWRWSWSTVQVHHRTPLVQSARLSLPQNADSETVPNSTVEDGPGDGFTILSAKSLFLGQKVIGV